MLNIKIFHDINSGPKSHPTCGWYWTEQRQLLTCLVDEQVHTSHGFYQLLKRQIQVKNNILEILCFLYQNKCVNKNGYCQHYKWFSTTKKKKYRLSLVFLFCWSSDLIFSKTVLFKSGLMKCPTVAYSSFLFLI